MKIRPLFVLLLLCNGAVGRAETDDLGSPSEAAPADLQNRFREDVQPVFEIGRVGGFSVAL